MEKWVQEKGVVALDVAPTRDCGDSALGSALQQQEQGPQRRLQRPVQVVEPEQQQVMLGAEQEQLQVNPGQQQREETQQRGERKGCVTDGKEVQGEQGDKESMVLDSQQRHRDVTKTPQQPLSEIRRNEVKVGKLVVEGKRREELFCWSASAKDVAEERQKGARHERYHRREGELCDEEEDEDQEQQQLPSTVDSVASSTSGGNAAGGAARTVAGFGRSSTDCGANGSISQFACADILHSISSTPLLTAGTAAETPLSAAAVCDAFVAPSLQLPLPAPLKKSTGDVEAAGAAGSGAAASVRGVEGGKGGAIAAAAGAVVQRRATGKEKDAAAAAKAAEKKGKEEKENEHAGLQGGAAGSAGTENTTGSGAPRDLPAAGAGVTDEERAAAAASYAEAELARKRGQGGGEAAPVQGDARGKLAAGRDGTAPHHSLWLQSRKKQSVAEQGRIAAAAVAAATRLFGRGEGANSSHHVGDHPQEEVVEVLEQQQQFVDMPCGEKGRSFSLAVAGPTSHGFPRPRQQEQRQEQQQGTGPHQTEEGHWPQHMDEEQQQQQKRLHHLEAEEQGHQEERGFQQEQQTGEEEKQEGQREQMQQESSHSIAIRLLAEELQEEGRKMLKAFCGEEEGDIAATEDSSALLLPHDDLLFKSNSVEVGHQSAPQDNRLWDRCRSEGEQLKQLVLGKGLVSSSAASLYSLLQQQKDAPALLISAAALQREASTKRSSVALFSPRKPSPARGFLATAAASRDITVATVAAGDEATPLAREAARGLGGGREGEESNTTSYSCLFQRREAANDSSGHLPPHLRATAGQDVVLSLMDLPRVLSLASKAAPPLKAAGFPGEQQPSVDPPSKPSTSAALAAQYASAAAALAGSGDAGAASRHAHLPETSRKVAGSAVHQQQPFLHAEVAEGVGLPAAPAACLSTDPASATEGGRATAPSSSVRSLCLQAAMRPPPGFDAKAGEWPPQKAEQARHCISDASGTSTTSATTAGTLVSAPAGKKSPASAAEALLASATEESLAAAVAVLAAVVATPATAASTETGAATGGACGRDPLFPVGEPFGAAAAAGTAAADHVSGSSSAFSQREGRSSPEGCRSGSPFDPASKHFFLAALTRERPAAATAAGLSRAGAVEAAATVGDAGSSAVAAAAAAARQAAALASRAGEKQSSGEEAAAAPGFDAGSFFSRETAVGGRGSGRTGFPSFPGGLRSLSAGESESGPGGLLLAKQQQLLSLAKHRSTQKQQQQQQPERRYVPHRGGSEAGGSLRFFDPAGEGRAAPEGRAVPEGRATMPEGRAAAEGGRAAGCGASSLPSYGGRGVYKGAPSGNNHSGSRHTWLRKGEHLEQQQQLQHGSNSSRGAYGRGQGERNSRRGAAAAAREKLAQELKKDGFKVFFGNASALTTEEEMYGLFRQFGECSELILLRDRRQRLRGAGFVTFRSAADAMRAIEGLDRKHTVLGGTKPLEVRIPENSEQKRERIRALARLRAENAQQSQEHQQLEAQQQQQPQQQHGNHQQQDYQQQQQQLGYNPQQQYTQQRHSFSQLYSTVARHPQYTTTSQRQQFSQQRQQQYATAQQQQPHAYYEQQLRGVALQRAQQQHAYYEQQEQQQQRRGMSLQRAQGYAVGGAGERVKVENRQEILWQAADAHGRDAAHRSPGSTPEHEKPETRGETAAVARSASALEALLAVTAAQHRQQQMQQDYKNRTPAENSAEGTQELLAWMQGYTRREDRSAFSAFADQRQQREQQPHLLQQSDGYPITKLAHSLYHAPGNAALCSNTLHADNPVVHAAAPAGAAAAAGERGEEQKFCRETRCFASPLPQRRPPSVVLNHALAAAFPSSPGAVANDAVFERISCSSETAAGGPLWQGSRPAIDQKTTGSCLPRAAVAARCSRGSASSPEGIGDAGSAIASATAGGAATADAHALNKADSTASEERGLAYINAFANVLTNRETCFSSRCLERDAIEDSRSSWAVGSRYGVSPGAYLQMPSLDTASVLQSATGGSPAAPPPLAPPPAAEKSNPVNGDVYACKAATAEALTSLEGLRFFPLQQPDSGNISPLDLFCGAGKLSESWIKKLTRLRETD